MRHKEGGSSIIPSPLLSLPTSCRCTAQTDGSEARPQRKLSEAITAAPPLPPLLASTQREPTRQRLVLDASQAKLLSSSPREAGDRRPSGRATRTSSRRLTPWCHSVSPPAPTTPRGCERTAKRGGRIDDRALPSPLLPRITTPRSASRRVVACCKSNNGTTKARGYRFMKWSEKKKLTPYLEVKKTQ